MSELGTGIGMVIFLLVALLTILWIALPILVWYINAKMTHLVDGQRRTNQLLEDLKNGIKHIAKA